MSWSRLVSVPVAVLAGEPFNRSLGSVAMVLYVRIIMPSWPPNAFNMFPVRNSDLLLSALMSVYESPAAPDAPTAVNS